MTGLKRDRFTVIEQCRVLGYVSTIAGRRRYLPNISSTTNRAGRAQAERQAVNTTVQGSAADLVKVACRPLLSNNAGLEALLSPSSSSSG